MAGETTAHKYRASSSPTKVGRIIGPDSGQDRNPTKFGPLVEVLVRFGPVWADIAAKLVEIKRTSTEIKLTFVDAGPDLTGPEQKQQKRQWAMFRIAFPKSLSAGQAAGKQQGKYSNNSLVAQRSPSY